MTPKRSKSKDRHERDTEIALFRYGLVAQLIHDPPEPGQQEQLLREIASKTYRIPYSSRTTVGVSTLRRYLKTYQKGGFEALQPQKRSDAGKPRAFPSEALEKAIALREEQPARTTRTIVDILQRDPEPSQEEPINVHTLSTHLRQRGKTRRLLKTGGKTYRRFERQHVNSLWQGDAMFGPWLPDPRSPGKKRRTHLFCFLDDHSRLVPYAEFFFEEALPRMERVLKLGILRRGLPRAIYVDNGQVYSATQFRAACATLGIRLIHTAPYAPQAKGKQERFFETLRAQFLPEVEISTITTLLALNQSFWAWLECIYHRHVHSQTKQTPIDRYQAGIDQVVHADAPQLRTAFLWREKRKVREDATLSLQGNRYQVEPHLAGRTLELRFDPFDLYYVDLFLDDMPLGRAIVLVQRRKRHLAVERLVTEPPASSTSPQFTIDFLAALQTEYETMQRKAAGRLRFSKLSPSEDEPPTEN